MTTGSKILWDFVKTVGYYFAHSTSIGIKYHANVSLNLNPH